MINRLLTTTLIALATTGLSNTARADGPSPIRTLGPTGLEISVQKDQSLKVTAVQPGSPAEGKLTKGQVITTINGQAVPADFQLSRQFLADQITTAEASTGTITFATTTGDVTITLPTLGSFSPTWPLNCPKTEKIVAANTAYLRQLANDGVLSDHNMNDAMGLLALLSTGDEKDLDAVRTAYATRMAAFHKDNEIGSHTWHNGYSGIATCEYYLRTGDQSVMPLIDAICEAGRKWQVQGGWVHWAQGVNPQYVGGGLLNAAGTNMLTTFLLAKHCGAKVNDQALNDALHFFYRFVGHGANPYGDHRPDNNYNSNNGKSEQITMAMQAASLAENGSLFAKARDKNAQTTIYAYRNMLGGHTGPIGTLWYGPAASLMVDKRPQLFRHRLDDIRWWYELSRLHDGSFVISSAARYDSTEYGRAMLLGLTGPRKNLQITGAPRSKFGVPFTLPDHVWGRPADTAFFNLDGGPAYKPLDPVPHIEYNMIPGASVDQLRQVAAHPEQLFRVATAKAIRDGGHFQLIEELLGSTDPLSRDTACVAINQFEGWSMRYSKGWASGQSIDTANFTPLMFKRLISMVGNPDEAIWLVDRALMALVVAKPEQTMAHLDTITPWLNHSEWWLQQSACFALSPALTTDDGAEHLVPKIADIITTMNHTKGRDCVLYMLERNIDSIPENGRAIISSQLLKTYQNIPSIASTDGEMDKQGITSVNLTQTLATALAIDPSAAPQMAKLSVARSGELRERERDLQIDALIYAATKLGVGQRKQVGDILRQHYRKAIFAKNAEALSPDFKGHLKTRITPLNTVLAIDDLSGIHGGWKLIDNNHTQQWWVTSFEPAEKRDPMNKDRHRDVALPEHLNGWFKPDYDPTANGWKKHNIQVGDKAPEAHPNQPAWKAVDPNAGEVIFMRKTIDVEDPDQTILRIIAYTRQGYQIYLNGELIVDQKGRSKTWWPRVSYDENGKIRAALRKGTNVIAATSYLQYFKGKEGDIEVYLEGLKNLPKPN